MKSNKNIVKFFFISFFLLITNFSLKAQEIMNNKLPFSPSAKTGNLIFISGQVGINPQTSKLENSSFENELKQVMKNIETQLKIHQLEFDDLINTTIYLKDIKNYDLLNKIYGEYFKAKYPTRTCIVVLDLPANASVEINGIAVKQ
ncbi:Rid family detoxifying hydrolase [Chryseobacterium sp.]|uniref:RidA family protein n=1 Tax=Chryseobacterium sp. TaxID=1871047 RepID=UPI00289FC6A3|nr:Rid family detoxifying hydrolase [Chryseobacterium sp.]